MKRCVRFTAATTPTPSYFFCDQYSNEDNWRAHYETTAVEILEQTAGRLTHVIAGVGTGGTVTGLGRRLKEHDPKIRLICVLPEVFPGIEGLKPLGSPEPTARTRARRRSEHEFLPRPGAMARAGHSMRTLKSVVTSA